MSSLQRRMLWLGIVASLPTILIAWDAAAQVSKLRSTIRNLDTTVQRLESKLAEHDAAAQARLDKMAAGQLEEHAAILSSLEAKCDP